MTTNIRKMREISAGHYIPTILNDCPAILTHNIIIVHYIPDQQCNVFALKRDDFQQINFHQTFNFLMWQYSGSEKPVPR